MSDSSKGSSGQWPVVSGQKEERGVSREEREAGSGERKAALTLTLSQRERGLYSESRIPESPNPESPNPNPFYLQIDPPGDGAWNMGVDEALLEAAATKGISTLRFYQWRQPTLSLGYFQLYEERQEHPASLDCPAVRRISGGGAILHDIELTYCLALPDRHPLAVNRLRTYRVVHEGLIGALSDWGIEARLVVCDEACQNPATAKQPFLCFQRRTRGDVVVGNAKVAGSAQRRCRGAVMQHGSVLLAQSAAAPELAGLKEKSNTTIIVDDIIQAWLSRLGPAFGAQWRPAGLPEQYARRAAELMNNKYDSNHWTKNRGRN